MTYKKIGFASIAFIIVLILILVFACFLAFSTTYGYKSSKSTFSISNEGVVDKTTVIIDPGHGGIDPGACYLDLIEKDLNLKLALKLGEFLKLSDVNVIYTRNSDVLLGDGEKGSKKISDLKARLEIAENTPNCVFVSIHMNKYQNNKARGLQAFYASNTPLSFELAASIQQSCRQIDVSNKREIKPDGGNIYILENTSKTAVLIECGFLSNEYDAENLKSDDYQNKLAFCVYEGITKFIFGS